MVEKLGANDRKFTRFSHTLTLYLCTVRQLQLTYAFHSNIVKFGAMGEICGGGELIVVTETSLAAASVQISSPECRHRVDETRSPATTDSASRRHCAVTEDFRIVTMVLTNVTVVGMCCTSDKQMDRLIENDYVKRFNTNKKNYIKGR